MTKEGIEKLPTLLDKGSGDRYLNLSNTNFTNITDNIGQRIPPVALQRIPVVALKRYHS